jgi:hypothetical protein
MKINIFARHCKFSANSIGKERPQYFSREGCFNNLLNTVDQDCEINVSFDGALKGSGHFLENSIYRGKYTLFEKTGGTDAASFLNVLEYANSLPLKDNDIVYFTEDDYLHNIGWPEILREGFIQTAADYITLYDHNDKYFFRMYEELSSKIISTTSVHWRSIPNTTNTYACLVKTLKRDYKIHKMYCDLQRGLTRDCDKFGHLFNDGRTLISPIPGYSTHCETQFMAPVVNWEAVYKKTQMIYGN